MHVQNAYVLLKSAVHEALGVGTPDGVSEKFVVLDFRCGNERTLAGKSVVDDVKTFYERFYTKSKTVVMTRGRSKNVNLATVEGLLNKVDADKSPGSMKAAPETKNSAFQNEPVPVLKHSTFIFVDTQLGPRILIRCYLDGTDKGYTHYMIKELQARLQTLLINKLNYCSGMDVDYTNHRTFYEVEFDAQLTETGILNAAKVVGVIRHLILKAGKELVLSKDRFLQYRLKQQQNIFLQKRQLPQQTSFQKFVENYMKFGVRGIFAEDKLPEEYDETAILAALEKLKKADWIIIYNDKFTIAKENEHPSTAISLEKFIEATNTGNRLSLSSLQKVDDTVESKLQLIPEPKNEAPFTGFNTTLAALDTLVSLSPLKDGELLPQPGDSSLVNNYNIREETVAAMVKSFSPTLRTPLDLEWEPVKPDSIVFEATYPPSMSLPLVEMVIDLNYNRTSLNVVEYFSLMFAKGVLESRLKPLDYQLRAQGGELTIKASPSGLQLSVSVLPSQTLLVVQDIKKAIEETTVTHEEWRNSLHHLKSESEVIKKPFEEALLMFESWACPYIPNKFMVETHFEKSLQKPPIKELPKLVITEVVLIRQRVNPELKELNPTVDAKNIGQYLPLAPGVGFSKGPDSLKDLNYFTNNNHTTVKLSLKSATTGPLAPGVYLMNVPLGKRTARLAQIMGTLRPLFHTAVYRHLRRELNIGYVTAVQTKGFLGQFYLQAIVQSDRSAKEVDAAMVEVISRLRTQVAALTVETLEQLKSLTAGIIVTPFESISSEAEFWKAVFREGLGPRYFQDSLDAAKSLTLAEVKDVFNQRFGPENFLNIVMDLQPTGQISSADMLKALLGM